MSENKSAFRVQSDQVKKRVRDGEAVDAACSELFHLGYDLERQGKSDLADSLYQQAIELLEDSKAEPGSSLTDISLAKLAFTHGKTLLRFGKARSAIAALRRALELVDLSLGSGTNGLLLERKALILGWLALSQRKAELFEESLTSYEQAIQIWRKLPDMIGAPVSPYSGFLGACLLGCSKSLQMLGQFDLADSTRIEAEEILEKEFELLKGVH